MERRNKFSVTPFLSDRRYAAHNASSNSTLGFRTSFLIRLFGWHRVGFRSASIGLAFASNNSSWIMAKFRFHLTEQLWRVRRIFHSDLRDADAYLFWGMSG